MNFLTVPRASDMSDTKPSLKIAALSVEGPLLVKVAKKRLVSVPDLAEASRVCREHIDSKGIGARGWSGGEVLRDDESRECVAVVSYNGRVWVPGGTNPEGRRLASSQEFDLG